MKPTRSMMDFVYFQGKIVPQKKAQISLGAHSLQYGTTVFGGMRGYFFKEEYRLFRMADHHKRLSDAAKIFGMDWSMSFEDFSSTVEKLIQHNAPKGDFYLRPFVFSQEEILTPKFHDLLFELGMYMIPLGDYLDTSKGLRLMISTFQKFPDSSISTKAKAGGSYLHSAAARSQANRLGYDEALVMNHEWKVVEGSAENLIMIYRGKAYIPPLTADALEGITLRTAIELLTDANIPIVYQAFDRSTVYTCDELILTGTAAGFLYAESVDDRLISKNMGPVCQLLRENFQAIVNKKHKYSKDWITCIAR